MRIFNSRKGLSHELFFNVFELVLASIVLLALLYFVNDIAKRTIFEKNYMARDTAILLNTLYSAPGEVIYNYNEKVEDFTFDFLNNEVKLYGKEDKEFTNIFYPFAQNKNIPFQDKKLNYEKENVKIKFQKSDDFMSAGKPDK